MLHNKSLDTLFGFFLFFYKPYKMYVILFLFCTSLVGLHGLMNSYFTKIIIDILSNLENNSLLLKKILWPAIFIVLNFEVHSLCWRGINYVNLKTSPVIKNNVISYVFNYVHSQSHRFFQENLSGSISSNISILSDNMDRVASIISVRIVKGTVQLLAALLTMCFIHPVFSLALLTWTICFTYISLFFSKEICVFSDAYAQSQAHVSGKIVDSVANFSNVRVFSRINFELSYLQHSLNLMQQKFQSKEWFLIKFYFAQGLSITCLIGFMVYFLVHLKINGQATIGDFAFILGVSLYVTENVWEVTEQIDQMNDAIGKCKQSLTALFTPIDIQDKIDAKPIRVLQGKIIFKNVQFHYKGAKPLFQNKSVEIMSKQKVGLVGYSGSGKSTFVSLLLRLYDVTSGTILIDGQDIRDVTQNSLHSAIGIIPQDPSLFHRSLMENIRYGRLEATDDEVVEASKRANAHEFICQLTQGYDSLVGERGVKLSGGQRQRIAIARVILKNPSILILDEATSQLDSVTENTIKKSLYELISYKTTIIIAHRLSTLLHMDRLLVFDQGKIVEDGAHQELLANGKLYKKLWDAQVGEFLPE